tara:strand:+ start:926 stop:1396 length:471 start_codon:yes stop_codon:yes gene_type:complete
MIKSKKKSLLILPGIFLILVIISLLLVKFSDLKETKIQNKNINIEFKTNVAKELPWKFKSNQSLIKAKIGQVYRLEFDVKNEGAEIISGKAAYDIKPNFFKEYFIEMDCFCYKKQTLLPGEKSKYSITFYIDKDVLSSSKFKNLNDIKILYTFKKY